ncbi:hypothetical protein M9458_046702, partial [Cirrhinus mrigala]
MILAVGVVDHLEAAFGVTMMTGGTTVEAAGSAMEIDMVTVKRDTRDGMKGARREVGQPKLNLKPRSVPKEEDQSSGPSASTGRAASIFGGAKPVDTAAKEREVEERLKKEQERLQRQLEEDKNRGPERKPRE